MVCGVFLQQLQASLSLVDSAGFPVDDLPVGLVAHSSFSPSRRSRPNSAAWKSRRWSISNFGLHARGKLIENDGGFYKPLAKVSRYELKSSGGTARLPQQTLESIVHELSAKWSTGPFQEFHVLETIWERMKDYSSEQKRQFVASVMENFCKNGGFKGEIIRRAKLGKGDAIGNCLESASSSPALFFLELCCGSWMWVSVGCSNSFLDSRKYEVVRKSLELVDANDPDVSKRLTEKKEKASSSSRFMKSYYAVPLLSVAGGAFSVDRIETKQWLDKRTLPEHISSLKSTAQSLPVLPRSNNMSTAVASTGFATPNRSSVRPFYTRDREPVAPTLSQATRISGTHATMGTEADTARAIYAFASLPKRSCDVTPIGGTRVDTLNKDDMKYVIRTTRPGDMHAAVRKTPKKVTFDLPQTFVFQQRLHM